MFALFHLFRSPPIGASRPDQLRWMARRAAIVGLGAIVPAALRWSLHTPVPITAVVIVVSSSAALVLVWVAARLPSPPPPPLSTAAADPELFLRSSTGLVGVSPRATAVIAGLALLAGTTFLFVSPPGFGSQLAAAGTLRNPPAPDGTGGGRPVTGDWIADGRVLDTAGYRDSQSGSQLTRTWTISRGCMAPGCPLYLRRQTGDVPLSAELRRHGDIYTATFPSRSEPCEVLPSGQTVFWTTGSTWRFDFDRTGTVATAEEESTAKSSTCGSGVGHTEWQARLQH